MSALAAQVRGWRTTTRRSTMTELVTTTRGDRVAYDRYGPAGIAATARLVAAEGVTVLVPDRLGRGERGRPFDELRERSSGPRPGDRGAAGRDRRGRGARRPVRALLRLLHQPVRRGARPARGRPGAVGGAWRPPRSGPPPGSTSWSAGSTRGSSRRASSRRRRSGT